MTESKKRRLQRKGWRFGDAADLLGLSAEEKRYVELKVRLAERLRAVRRRRRWGQVEMAEKIGSSQSRVAKMEAAGTSVSLDWYVRAFYRLGISNPEIARIIAGE